MLTTTTPKMSSATTETPTRWTPHKLLQNDSWISLVEAQQLAHGEVEWWKCPNIHGEQVPFLQTPNPVWSNGTKMYVGGWQKHHKKAYFQWHGPGVYYRQDGRILVGKWVDGKLKGLTKRLWCPNAPCWQDNRQPDSVLKNSDKQGVPFIYIGKYKGHWKEDHHAVVILKDGTTRKGPWKRNAPVGDWWNDHEKGYTSPEELSRIIGFSRIESSSSRTTTSAKEILDDNDNDDGSQAPTVVVNNTTQLSGVVDGECSELASKQLKSHIVVPEYDPTTADNKKDIIPPRKIYLEPDTSEPGDIMPGTALAHTMGEDDEEEIVFMAGDSMDDSLIPQQSQYNDEYIPTSGPVNKEINITDPLVSPISVRDDRRGVARRDLPQKLLFGLSSDDQEDGTSTSEYGEKQSISSFYELEDELEVEQEEEVPSEYQERSVDQRHEKLQKARSRHATPSDPPTSNKSSSALKRPLGSSDSHENRYNLDQLSALVNWLMVDVIGSNPSPAEMERYARHFLDVGLHSSLMITSTCTTADAANFSWMKPFHRRCFVLWAHKNCANSYQRQLISITTWLQFEVIGNDADILEMGYYARKLVSAGFHSVPMILAVCTYDDVDAFQWMKPIHRRLFLLRTGIANSSPDSLLFKGNGSTV